MFAGVLMSALTPGYGQIVGRTCGPHGCHLVIAAPPPTADALVEHICGGNGELGLSVTLMNAAKVPVPSNPKIWDTALFADGGELHPTFVTDASAGVIPPGGFISGVQYRTRVPPAWKGKAILEIGRQPDFAIDFDTLNDCPQS